MEARGVLFSQNLDLETPYVNELLGWEMQCVKILLEKKDMRHLCLENALLHMQIDAIVSSGGPCISAKWEEFVQNACFTRKKPQSGAPSLYLFFIISFCLPTNVV